MSSPREDDTVLDSIASRVRAFPPLDENQVAALLADARANPDGGAEQRLVEQFLTLALAAALARRQAPGIDFSDLFQEGSIAVATAVREHLAHPGQDSSSLRRHVEHLLNHHLDEVVARCEAEDGVGEALVRDAELFDAAALVLRRRLGREPSSEELAGLLDWPGSRVEVVGRMVERARLIDDADLASYLDTEPEANDEDS